MGKYSWPNNPVSGIPWWDTNYRYRRQLSITANDAVPNPYVGVGTFNLRTLGDVRSDLTDVRIVYWTGSTWVELDRKIFSDSWWIFPINVAIPAGQVNNNFWIYYGNPNPSTSPPTNTANIYVPRYGLNVISSYRFDEGTGIPNDTGPDNNDLDTSANGTYVRGKFGYAYQGNGVTQFALKGGGDINKWQNVWVVEFWLTKTKYGSDGGNQNIAIAKWGGWGNIDSFALGFRDGDGTSKVWILTDNSHEYIWNIGLPATWSLPHHVAYVFRRDVGGFRFYWDGQLLIDVTSGIYQPTNTQAWTSLLVKGDSGWASRNDYFGGAIEQVVFSNVNRSAFPHATVRNDPGLVIGSEQPVWIAEQVESAPYTTTRLNLPETITANKTYSIQSGRLFTFSSAGQQSLPIRLPKQLYTSMSLDALVSNTGVSSGNLTLSLDIGDNASTDWSRSGSTTFPASFEISSTVSALNAYLISQTGVAWGAEIDVPFKVTVDRAAQVILTDLQLRLQFNQPEALEAVDISADKPLDWTLVVPGGLSQGTWYNYTHDMEPEPISLHPVKVYNQAYNEPPLGTGKYATDFNPGVASYAMFGDGRDGPYTVASNTTYLPVDSSAYGSASTHSLYATNPSFAVGQKILIHQSRGTGVGQWEINQIASYTAGIITTVSPLAYTYTDSGASQAQVLVLRQYSSVTINSGATLSAKPWDGNVGGILAFLCNGTVDIQGIINIKGNNGSTSPDGDNIVWYGTLGTGFIGGTAINDNTSSPYTSYQGEGFSGSGTQNPAANGNGGGGGYKGSSDRGSGGGGGNGTAGGAGTRSAGGLTSGSPDLTNMVFGGGGGGGYKVEAYRVPSGGSGGGILLLQAKQLIVTGAINANGGNGSDAGAGSGGGAGGSVLIKTATANLGTNRIAASGGSGGTGQDTGSNGGSGGVGRIRVEYCESVSGESTPVSSKQKLTCYIAEQVETAPYNQGLLNLPADTGSGITYQIQYGRRFVFSGASQQTSYLRLNRQVYASASLDALVSNVLVPSGSLNLQLDFGNDGSFDWAHNATTTFPAALAATGWVDGLNTYLLSRIDIPWGSPVDVPVRVSIDRQADVILTNLALNPVGTKTRYLRLPAQLYSDLRFSLQFGQAGDPAGELAFTVDVGADGTVDWSNSSSHTYPAVLNSPNLATVFNSYLSGLSGEVDVPIRIVPSPFLETKLDGFTFTPQAQADLSLAVGDISFDAVSPTEGSLVNVTATLHNLGGLASRGVTTGFYATPPGGSEVYIGAAFVPDVPAGGTAQAVLPWDTLGFTGSVPVRVKLDPTNRLKESSELNNQAIKNLTILTRPDLLVSAASLSMPEPLAGVPVTITLQLENSGETAAVDSTLALYDGDLAAGGLLLGELALPLGSLSDQPVSFGWTPAGLGAHRLYVQPDRDGVVNESNESNNLFWQDVYVGLPGPVLLDSGLVGEPAYTSALGYGFIDEGQADALGVCGAGTLPFETFRRDPLGQVVYQFNHLQPGHYYHLDLTLYECDSAGRQESIYIDDILFAGPVDLGDKQVHRLSLLVDPALYADHALRVMIQAPGIDGAIVSEVNLHDIDYRYADAGGSQDPQYPSSLGYGWLDGSANTNWGVLPYQSARVDQTDSELHYRFDKLQPGKSYKLNLAFWQPSGTGRILNVNIDGVFAGLTIDTWDYQLHQSSIPVPLSSYAADGSIDVSILRSDATTGAMVNEISLEEETREAGSSCFTSSTPYFSQVYGDVLISGQPAAAGTVVQALDPRGNTVGCFTVGRSGQYGFMRLYGEDTSVNPPIPGMRDGELAIFYVNGALAVSTPLFNWHDDRLSHRVDLNAGVIQGQSILQRPGWNLFSLNVEPAYPLVDLVLDTIDGRYDRVLGENGIYSTAIPPQYNTLSELHSGLGYFLHITSTATTNLLAQGLPQLPERPIALHSGWNWVGFLPQATLPITEALQSIEGHYQLVHNLDSTFDPSLPEFSTLLEMKPGEGYLLYASQAVTLTYPAAAPLAPEQEVGELVADSLCAALQPTPAFSVVYGQVLVNNLPASPGAKVEFFTPRGELAGCTSVTKAGVLSLTHVYGAVTDVSPGFYEGELLEVRVNGLSADLVDPLFWSGDMLPHLLAVELQAQQIFLPLVIGE